MSDEATTEEDMLRFLAELVRGGSGRIALFEPCPRVYTATIEALEGVAYVDCGRNYGWGNRLDTLEKVLRDGVEWVFLAVPNFPTGTRDDLKSFLALIHRFPSVWVLLDRRWEWEAFDELNDPQVLEWTRRGTERGTALGGGARQRLEALYPEWKGWKAQPMAPESAIHSNSEMDAIRSTLEADTAFRISTMEGPYALVQQVGRDSREVGESLAHRGISSWYRKSHTWRGGVLVGQGGGRDENV